jgi:PHP family Zn ribbon phosphoesterase
MDLHVHTVLSACAEAEMLPPLIVERALELGLGAVAITDHNSAENAGAVQAAAEGSGLVVFPGLEVFTREEVDLLAIFGDEDSALRMQALVYQALGEAENRPEFFGEQILVDAEGRPCGENRRLLQAATALSVENAVASVHRLGGMVLAAHVDRPARSLIASLGFVPPELDLDGIEVSPRADPEAVMSQHPDLGRFGVGVFSDAHRLSEMGARTWLWLEAPELDQVKRCFRDASGTMVRVAGNNSVGRVRQGNGC